MPLDRKAARKTLRELRAMRRMNRVCLDAGKLLNRPLVLKEASGFMPKLDVQIAAWEKALAR
jgi:hypothetical protein